jgi:NADH:ubiquinone oxidoreductase subunit 2 (subunit N)
MHIVSMVKFVIGVVLLLGGGGVLVSTKSQRGFNQTKQAGVLMLLVGAVFVAIGFGFSIRGLLE